MGMSALTSSAASLNVDADVNASGMLKSARSSGNDMAENGSSD
jgi:hypothetical protein